MVDGPRDADPQSSVEDAPQGGERVATSLGRSEGRAGVREERLARSGKGDRAPIAVKEHLPEFALQAPDLCADGRLGHRLPGSCARELPFLGHRDEARELSQVHNDTFCKP
jgi:hypothetical protein